MESRSEQEYLQNTICQNTICYESVRCSYPSLAAALLYLYSFISLMPSPQDTHPHTHAHLARHIVNNTAGFIAFQKCNFSHFLVRCRVFNLLMSYKHAQRQTHTHTVGMSTTCTHGHTRTHQILCRRLDPSLWGSFLWLQKVDKLFDCVYPSHNGIRLGSQGNLSNRLM